MKKISLSLLLVFLCLHFASAGKVRWSYFVEGSEGGIGAGTPNTYAEGFNTNCAAVEDECEEGKEPKKRAKSPAAIQYYFMPFDAQQVVISENYNAGSIVKINIQYIPDGKDDPVSKTIYEGKASPVAGYRVSNYNFEPTKNVVGVDVYLDYKAVPGVNQIAGVGLTDFPEKYSPHINLSKDNTFETEVMYMNDDITRNYNPSTPILSIDGKYIYFSHQDGRDNQIYRATIGEDGKNIGSSKKCV